jgi:hypothetical protein
MQNIKITAWVAFSVVVGLYWIGQGQPCLVSAADVPEVPNKGRLRQEIDRSFCNKHDSATFDEREEVKLLHSNDDQKRCVS